MPTKAIQLEALLPIKVEDYFSQCLFSPAFHSLETRMLGLQSKSVVFQGRSNNNKDIIRTSTTPENSWVPSGLERATGDLTFIDTYTLNLHQHAPPYTIHIHGTVPDLGDNVWITRTITLSAAAHNPDLTLQQMTGEVHVKIFGIGRIVQNILVNSMKQTYEQLPEIVSCWVEMKQTMQASPRGRRLLSGELPPCEFFHASPIQEESSQPKTIDMSRQGTLFHSARDELPPSPVLLGDDASYIHKTPSPPPRPTITTTGSGSGDLQSHPVVTAVDSPTTPVAVWLSPDSINGGTPPMVQQQQQRVTTTEEEEEIEPDISPFAERRWDTFNEEEKSWNEYWATNSRVMSVPRQASVSPQLRRLTNFAQRVRLVKPPVTVDRLSTTTTISPNQDQNSKKKKVSLKKRIHDLLMP